MNIQMQTVGVFSAPLVVIAKINFLKVVTKLWIILLTMLEINVFFFCDYENEEYTSVFSYPSVSHRELHWRQLVVGKNTPYFKRIN